MAKKMKISSLLTALAAILGVVAIIMLFVPAIGLKDADGTYKGMNVVFGLKEKLPVIGTEYTVLNFSFMNLLTYLLVLAGTVLSLLNVLAKKPSKLFSLIAAAAFLVAGIFFFCTLSFTSFNDDISKVISGLGGDIKSAFKLAAGSIVGGVLSILSAICAASPFFLKK